MILEKYEKSEYKGRIQEFYQTAESIRKTGVEITLAEVFEQNTGKKIEALYEDMGIETHKDTVENIVTLPDAAARWLMPEIWRESLRLGMRKAPIYPNIIAFEESINGLEVHMPHLNMSDAAPRYVGEAETIQMGSLSYGDKSFKIRKMGRGIELSDEVKQYSSLKVVSVFLQDFGVKLGYALDTLAMDILLNGDQADGSESAPVVGVTTPGTVAYRDLLRVWIRLSRMGKSAQTMISGEAMALNIMDLDEYKLKTQGSTEAKLNLKTPVPNSADLYIHGAIPDDQVVILDPRTTMMKFNARPLLVESERIVSNQTEATYASLTTGFGIMFRDSRLIIDEDLNISAAPLPSYMNVDALEQVEIK